MKEDIFARFSSDKPSDEAVLFFAVFSRFEYSLKQARFLDKGQDAKPDWETFSKDLEDEFRIKIRESSDDTPLRLAIKYFANHPPSKQIVKIDDEGSRYPDWDLEKRIPENEISLKKCLIYVRRVRNNLFHGGKVPQPMKDPTRDQELLKHSLCLLEECLNFEHEKAKAVRGCLRRVLN